MGNKNKKKGEEKKMEERRQGRGNLLRNYLEVEIVGKGWEKVGRWENFKFLILFL